MLGREGGEGGILDTKGDTRGRGGTRGGFWEWEGLESWEF